MVIGIGGTALLMQLSELVQLKRVVPSWLELDLVRIESLVGIVLWVIPAMQNWVLAPAAQHLGQRASQLLLQEGELPWRIGPCLSVPSGLETAGSDPQMLGPLAARCAAIAVPHRALPVHAGCVHGH